MSTTVRITEGAKNRIRRLQETWRRKHGDAVAQQTLLEKGLEYLERHEDAFVSEAGWQRLPESEIQRLLGLQGHYGRWSSDDIDDIVYGAKQ